MVCSCSGSCSDLRRRVKIYDDIDFRYSVYPIDPKPDDELMIQLEGLSEVGKSKQIIVVPDFIDGKPVTILSAPFWMGYIGQLESENLEVLYFKGTPKCNARGTFQGCPNLKKIVWLKTDLEDEIIQRCLRTICEGINRQITTVYVCSSLNTISYRCKDTHPANISYLYNYEGAKNEGYYWVDNFDYGEKIGYVPENPEREGYVFGGWYKEPECVTVWDFNTDTLPEAKYAEETGSYEDEEWHREEGEELYQETRLYAKWYKN